MEIKLSTRYNRNGKIIWQNCNLETSLVEDVLDGLGINANSNSAKARRTMIEVSQSPLEQKKIQDER